MPTIENLDERAGRDALTVVLKSLRVVSNNGRLREPWISEATERAAQGDRIAKTVLGFGSGLFETALHLLLLHPFLMHPDDTDGLGLEGSAVQKLEQRWLAAWKAVQQ
jgi:hypothetical protein